MLEEFEEGRKDPFHYEDRPSGKIICVTFSPIIKNGEFVGYVQTLRPKHMIPENE
jgi:sensor histidine kinase regulating citrate/malate metabolism